MAREGDEQRAHAQRISGDSVVVSPVGAQPANPAQGLHDVVKQLRGMSQTEFMTYIRQDLHDVMSNYDWDRYVAGYLNPVRDTPVAVKVAFA